MERETQKQMDLSSSTVMDNEVDIIVELKNSLDVIEDALEKVEAPEAKESVSFMKFLVTELEDTLSGDYERLRYMRFIMKKTPI
jgi:hypothetical protein